MSTRSQIGVETGGVIKSIYCHSDGYLAYVGRLLQTYYNTQEKAEELISYGDASCLGEEIGHQVDFHKRCTDANYYEATRNQCVFYHRDRGEELSILEISESDLAKEYSYNYLFKNGQWYVSCSDTEYKFEPLKDYL